MANPLCHFEFLTDDPRKCKEFYSKVFDWTFDSAPNSPDYVMINTGQEPGGGLMKRPEGCPAPTVGIYFLVDDIDATLAKVTEAGGKIVMPKRPIEGIGACAVFVDTENIGIGLFQTKEA